MSTITRPILLDETGRAINETLGQIRDALLRGKAAIDDEVVSKTSVWSSAKIVAALTVEDSASAAKELTIEAVESTPIDLAVELPSAGTYTLRQQAGARTITYDFTVPAPGTLIFSSGLFSPTAGGEEQQLPAYAIAALPGGENVFSINDAAAYLTASFRTLASNAGWDVISGGNSQED